MADTYICDCCRETFETGWPEEEARAEAKERFGIDDIKRETVDTLCDDCFNIIVPTVDGTEIAGLIEWRSKLSKAEPGLHVMAGGWDSIPVLRRGSLHAFDVDDQHFIIRIHTDDKLYLVHR